MTRPVTCPGRAYPPRRIGKVMRDRLTALVIGVVVGECRFLARACRPAS